MDRPVKLLQISLRVLVVFMGVTVLAPMPVSAETPPPTLPSLSGKNVLILHSHEANAPLFLETDKGLSGALNAGGISSQHQFFESLDFRRNPGGEYRTLLAKEMRVRYRQRKPDAIITMYPEALEFVLKDCKDVFPRAPVLALYLPRNFKVPVTDRPIVGHFPRFDVGGTLETALKLAPGTKRVYVVAGTHQVDKEMEDQTRLISKKWEGKIDFLYLSQTPFEEILTTVSKASPASLVLFLNISRDAAGDNRISPETVERLSEVSSAPIFGVLDVTLGHGIVGGSLANFERVGSKAGELVLDILRGAGTADGVPAVLDVPSIPMFDWRQIRHWRLNESALPKGSIVINKHFSIWDFRYYIAGALLLCSVETALVIFLILQMRRRRIVEEGLRQKTEELDRFFDVGLDSLCIADTDGRFLRLNPAWEKILSYTCEELTAKRFLDFVHPDDMTNTVEAIDALASQQKITSFENRYRAKDGTYRWLQWAAAPAGKLIYAVARDVTERKNGEEVLKERLRFEQLLSNLSARFVNIPPERVDSEVDRGLREILGFFRVDRIALLRAFPDEPTWRATHGAAIEDAPPVQVGVDLPKSLYPWTYETLVQKREVVSFSTLGDLPPEANADRLAYVDWGIRSSLDVPVVVGDPVDRVIAMQSTKNERYWRDEDAPRLRLIGEILVNALERKAVRVEIEERLRFEGLIAGLWSRFANLPPQRIKIEIEKSLGPIAEFFGADRCHIRLLSEDGAQLVRAFEYRPAASDAGPEILSKDQTPWYLDQLIRGNQVVISRLDDLPPEAEKERRLCLDTGLKSFLSVPMQSEGRITGSCTILSTRVERVWPEGMVQRFRTVAEVFANILQRRRAEGMVRTSEEKFRQFFSHTPEYCYILSPEGTILDVNDQALKTLGYQKDQLVGKPVAMIYAPESLTRMEELLWQFRQRGEIDNEEMTIVTKDGERRVVLLNVGAVRDGDGTILHSASVQTDITERRRAEFETFVARREMLRLERLLRMGELSASLAHELNQPLTSILSNARAATRLLEAGRLGPDELKEILNDIAHDDKRAGDVVRSLRSMVRVEEGEMEAVPAAELVNEAVALFNSEAIIRNIRVDVDMGAFLPSVKVNRVQIQQVIINLAMNAIEAMEAEAVTDRRLVIGAHRSEQTVTVSVRDFGMGIDASETKRLFEPFFTTKTSGLGMGLSLSRSIMEAHGGHIWAVNNSDKGATFFFDLPVRDERPSDG